MRNVMMPSETRTVQPSLLQTQTFMNERGIKAETYIVMNPESKVHPVYVSRDYVNEKARITFTKLRLSSHSLKIETGRWSRITQEDRLCECGGGG